MNPRSLYFLGLLLLLNVASVLVVGQVSPTNTLWVVTTVAATSSNPWFGQLSASSGFVYGLNGTGAAGPLSINVTRGLTYRFDTTSVSGIHPFYITTDSVGAGAGTQFTTPTTGSIVTWVADPTGTGINNLFYQCDNHPHMGGPITVFPAQASLPPSSSSSSTSTAINTRSSSSSTGTSSQSVTIVTASSTSVHGSSTSSGIPSSVISVGSSSSSSSSTTVISSVSTLFLNGSIILITSREFKNPGDPFYGVGSNAEFLVNGVAAPIITLIRGNTYFFNITVNTSHPFYITTNSQGSGAGTQISTPVTSSYFQYIADPNGDSLGTTQLYYQSFNDLNMGNGLVVIPFAPTGTVFNVNLVPRVLGDPFYNQGDFPSFSFGINGAHAPTLQLLRGATYTFNVNSVSLHPFYITSNSQGGDGGASSLGGGTFNGTFSYVATPTATGSSATTVYYECEIHTLFGNSITVFSGQSSPNAAHQTNIHNQFINFILISAFIILMNLF